MKKVLFALITIAACASSAFANINHLGLWGSNFNYSLIFLMGDDAPDFSDYSLYYTQGSFDIILGFGNHIGLHTGAGLSVGFGSYVRGNADVRMDLTGIHTSSLDPNDDEAFRLAIQIPAMVRFYATNIFFLEAGATFDINLFEFYYSGKYEEWNNRDDLKDLNIGVGGGFGFTLAFGLEFFVKYTHSLTKMYEYDDRSDFRLIFGIAYWFNYK